ncbi:MAG TPA: glucose 1-dehydrogenase [Bryobacteraceae bacterium]|jgi:threonine dehydrogenase-like Zn-dependent dehydrogenase
MKAVAVHLQSKEIGLVDRDIPNLANPDEVKIRMIEVGVCGTDKEICRFEYGTAPAGCEYLVLGHESLGQVEQVGHEVQGVAEGDLVVTMVRRPCGVPSCTACRMGHQDFCYTGKFEERGINQMHGFMTGFVVDHDRYICKVPSHLRDIAVLTEPLTIAEKGLIELDLIQTRLPWGTPGQVEGYNHSALVLGAGPVGILGAMALAVRGYTTYVYSQELADDPKAQLCTSFGARYLSAHDMNMDQVAAKIGNIDVIYEATGYSPLMFDAMRVLGINGVCILTGIPGHKGPIPVETDQIMRQMVLQNQVVVGTVNAPRQAFENAIADLETFDAKFPQAIRNVITRRYAIDEHKDLLLGKAGGLKNVLSMDKAV